MPVAAMLHIAVLCAAWQAQPVAAQRLDSLEGAPVRNTGSVPELIPLRTSGNKAAAAAGVSPAMAATANDRWWEHIDDDDTKCEATYARTGRVVGLTSAASAHACSDSCRVTRACNAWLWCSDGGGCLVDGGPRLSQRSCLLWHLDMLPQAHPNPDVPPDLAGLDMYNHTIGYQSGQLYRRPMRMHILTVQQRCTARSWASDDIALADHLSRVSLTNKVNYARLHGLTLQVVADAPGNKLAVIWAALEQMARTRASQKWLLWMGTASMVSKPTFSFPLEDYAAKGHNIVVRGHLDRIMAGDAWGFDSQMMLIRNTLWSRRFFRQGAQMFDKRADLKESIDLLAKLKPKYNVSAVSDRLVVSHMLRKSPRSAKHVHFEAEYCFGCGLKGLDLRGPTSYTISLHGTRQCNEHSLARDPEYNEDMDTIMRAEECSFMRALEQSRPILTTQPGSALAVPFTTRMQVSWFRTPDTSYSLRRSVLVPGKDNRQSSLEACRAACLAEAACTAWLYCWRPGGCDDGVNYNPHWYPNKACELLRLPRDVPVAHKRRPLAFSSSSMGFHRPGHRRFIREAAAAADPDAAARQLLADVARERTPARQQQSVAVVTAIPPNTCAHPAADAINVWSVSNKQDYAHRHGHEFHMSSHNIDPTVKGNFNKLKMLQKLLNETPADGISAVGWMWWIDIDTVVDPAQSLPLEKYAGKDIVLWGERSLVEAGDIQGLNTGSMLFRNSAWTRKLINEMCAHAHGEDLEAMRTELEREVHLVPGFFDTPLLLWALKHTPGNLDRVYFERSSLGLNRHFLQVEWSKGERPLVVHYAGCTFCARHKLAKLGDTILKICTEEMVKALKTADCRLGHQYLVTDADACTYDARDLSWVNIRLGT